MSKMNNIMKMHLRQVGERPFSKREVPEEVRISTIWRVS